MRQWFLRGVLLSPALLVSSAACTFPPYVPGRDGAGGQAGEAQAGTGALGGGSGASGGTGAMGGAGAVGGAGSAGVGGTEGEAGAGGSPEDPGIVLGWSQAALDQLDFELLEA